MPTRSVPTRSGSGVKLSHSETYDYNSTIAYRWDFPGGNLSGTFATKFASALSGVSENITRMITNFVELVPNNENHRIERSAVDPVEPGRNGTGGEMVVYHQADPGCQFRPRPERGEGT